MRLVRSLYDAEAVLGRTATVLRRLSAGARATPPRPAMRVRSPELPAPSSTRRFSSRRAAWLSALQRAREAIESVPRVLGELQGPDTQRPDTTGAR